MEVICPIYLKVEGIQIFCSHDYASFLLSHYWQSFLITNFLPFMAIWEFEGKVPKIGNNTYVADSATVLGDVTVGESCYIGPGAVLRGDYGTIEIGTHCSVQENVVIHARPDEKAVIGNWVTLGHGCLIHNSTIHDYATIGIRAVVSDYAEVGTWGVVGEAGLVRRGQKVSPYAIAVGLPVVEKGSLKERQDIKDEYLQFKEKYVEMAHRHLKEGSLRRIS